MNLNLFFNKKKLSLIFGSSLEINMQKPQNVELVVANTENLAILDIEKKNKLTTKQAIKKNVLLLKLFDRNLYTFLSKVNNKILGVIIPKELENSTITPPTKSTNVDNKGIFSKKIEIVNNTNKNINYIVGAGCFSSSNKKSIINKDNYTFSLVKTKNNNNFNNLNLKDTTKTGQFLPTNRILDLYSIINIDNTKTHSLIPSYNIGYKFYKLNKNTSVVSYNTIFRFLEIAFLGIGSLISKPIVKHSSKKILIQLFYYFSDATKSKYYKKRNEQKNIFFKNKFFNLNNLFFKHIALQLSKFFKKSIELDIRRLYYPYFDSNIFVNLLGIISKVTKFRFLFNKIYKIGIRNPKKVHNRNKAITNTNKKGYISGFSIKIAGAMINERIRPKKTVKIFSRGSITRGYNTRVELSRFTSKSNRGAYSISVTLGHVFL